jgi:hypothetical protein
MRTRYQLIAFIAAAYIGAAVLIASLVFAAQLARAFYLEYQMCINPGLEAPATPASSASDAITDLLEAFRDASNYVEMHTPHMRRRIQNAGGVVPDFDPQARVLQRLQQALAAVVS